MSFRKISLLHCSALALSLALTGSMLTLQQARAQTIATKGDSTVQLKAGKGTFIKMSEEANAVFVADPDIADVEVKFTNMLYVFGAKPGNTTVHVLNKDGKIIASRTIVVVANVQELQSALNDLVPNSTVSVHPVNDRMVLKGVVRSANEAETVLKVARSFVDADDKIINMITVNESNQITLRVRIAEVKKTVGQQFGINWQSSGNNTNGARFGVFGSNGVATLAQQSRNPITGALETIAANTLRNYPTPATEAYSLIGGVSNANSALDATVKALETEGLLTMLAEPNLTAVSGETASFLAGGEFPILVSQGVGAQATTTVEYKEFGVALNFSPVLLSNNRIRLRVNPVVSELSNDGAVEQNGFRIPGLQTRKVETTVELGDGESFTVAGLFQNKVKDDIKKFPWLGDLPVLGPLFRSKAYASDDTELLVIVTPFVVEPVSDSSLLKTPVDNVRIPTDKDRILYNQTIHTGIEPHHLGTAQKINGAVGFTVN